MKSKLHKIVVILDKLIFKSKSDNLACFSEHCEASICCWIKHKTKPQKL